MVALPKALERGRAWGCPSSPVSLHPAHVRSRVQPGICSWQSQHGPGCWQGASSRHPPWCWIHPWVHQEEQRGSLLCFDSLKIPNPAVLLPTRGVLAAPSTPGIPQPHQQPGREVAAPKKMAFIHLEPGEIFNQNFAKKAKPNHDEGAEGTKGHAGMCHHTGEEQSPRNS